jgi:hypothetical protein
MTGHERFALNVIFREFSCQFRAGVASEIIEQKQ